MSLISFDLAQQEYALPLDRVREIIPLPDHVSEVPRAETAVLGVVTLRDRLLPLVSLRALLGLPVDVDREEHGKVVVLSMGDSTVGMVADRTREILRVDAGPDRPRTGAADAGHRRRGDHIDLPSRTGPAPRRGSIPGPVVPVRAGKSGSCRARQTETIALKAKRTETPWPTSSSSFFGSAIRNTGCRSHAVDEIARPPDHITRLPKAPAFIDGVMNLRGIVVPIVDLRRRFEVASK